MGEVKQIDFNAAGQDLLELLNRHGLDNLNEVLGFLEVFKLDIYNHALSRNSKSEA